MKLSTYAKLHGIGYRAAWERFRTGRIPGAFLDELGHIVVPDPNSVRLVNAAIYARVSSVRQKQDLERQADSLITYANARGYKVVAVVKEVASGASDTRPKLMKLLASPEWGTLVIERKDRLTLMEFHWFEVLLECQGRSIDVANVAESATADLISDFTAAVYSLTSRLYGPKSAKRRAAFVRKALMPCVDKDLDTEAGD
jgi:predicted site-specific integrase-resolvase